MKLTTKKLCVAAVAALTLTCGRLGYSLMAAKTPAMPDNVIPETMKDVQLPDFNFPKDVDRDASARLAKAMARHDGDATVQALVQISLARTKVTSHCVGEVMELIDKAIAESWLSPAHRATLYYLEICMVKALDDVAPASYSQSRDADIVTGDETVKTDERDIALWSTSRRRVLVSSLADHALDPEGNGDVTGLMVPLGELHGIFTGGSELGNRCMPLLFDLLCYRCGRDMTLRPADFYTKWLACHATDDDILPTLFAESQAEHLDLEDNGRYAKTSAMRKLYAKYADHEESALLLRAQYPQKEDYELYCDYINRFPNSPFTAEMEDCRDHLAQPEVYVTYESVVQSSDSISAVVDVSNLNACTLSMYRLPDNIAEQGKDTYRLTDLELVETRIVSTDDRIPFRRQDLKTRFAPKAFGRYIIVPSYQTRNGTSQTKEWRRADLLDRMLSVSDMRTFHIALHDVQECSDSLGYDKAQLAEMRLFAVDSHTGQPLTGVAAQAIENGAIGTGTKNGQYSLTTGQDGYASFVPRRNFSYTMTSGQDRYLPDANVNGKLDGDLLRHTLMQIYTDLGIYRPGEQVHVSLFTSRVTATLRRPIVAQPLTVELIDPSGNKVDTVRVTTDDFGQAVCDFTLPTDRMNGNYRIKASIDDGSRYPWYESKTIQVSEYKTPTFIVSLADTKKVQPNNEGAIVCGQVMTYAGVPVAQTDVQCTLEVRSWWYYRSNPSQPKQRFTVRTDDEGRFSYTCPPSWTDEGDEGSSYRPFYTYHIEATCTNAAGETQQGHTQFCIGGRHGLVANDDECLIESGKPLRLNVSYRSADPKESPKIVNYELHDIETETLVHKGTFSTDAPQIDRPQGIRSGLYQLRVWIPSAPDAGESTARLTLYRRDDRIPVVKRAIWMPEEGKTIDEKGRASVLIGTATGGYIYYQAYNRLHQMGSGWLKYAPGMHTFTLPMPQDDDNPLDIDFFMVRDGETYRTRAHFEPISRSEVRLSAVSFRDKIIPGSTEHWTFSLTDGKGRPAQGRMMLTLYNEALQQLATNPWTYTSAYAGATLTRAEMVSYYNHSTSLYDRHNLSSNWPQVQLPSLFLYGTKFYRVAVRKDNIVMFRTEGRGARIVEGNIAPVPMIVDEAVLADVEEDREQTMMTATGLSSGEEGGQPSNESMELRSGEVKVAAWMPMLQTDDEGHFTIHLEVPAFNTTWHMQARAISDGLLSDQLTQRVLAQRPLMVQPSLPRFLRAGDTASLSASVMNATDEDMDAEVVVETFVPRTGEILQSERRQLHLGGKQTQAVNVCYTAASDMPYVGVRVTARNAQGDGDGEQQMLPILTNVSPIISATPFYMAPGEGLHSIDVKAQTQQPEAPTERQIQTKRLALEYCDNPTWYCVTALPTIADADAITCTGLAHSLFALALAERLADVRPDIREAISEWTARHNSADVQGADSDMLVSQLKKNADLKLGSLLASPWLSEAERQQARMEALERLFDKDNRQEDYDKLVGRMKKMQHRDGGFSWLADERETFGSSYWTTSVVAELMGELNHLGCLPDKSTLGQMMTEAVHYLDNETLRKVDEMKKELKKGEKINYVPFGSYVYIRSLYPGVGYAHGQQKRLDELTQQVLKSLEAHWGEESLPDRAYDAIVLQRKGRTVQAARIMESVRQYALTVPGKGMYWERVNDGVWASPVACTATILHAFAEVDARTPELDQIRQWLLLEKQTSDWGSSSLAADAVYALLETGTDWLKETTADAGFEISIDGQPLDVTPIDRRLGYVRIDLPTDSKRVEVTRSADSHPAWGSLYHLYDAPMVAVRAEAVPNLKVGKEIYVQESDGRWLHIDTHLSASDLQGSESDKTLPSVITEQAQSSHSASEGNGGTATPVEVSQDQVGRRMLHVGDKVQVRITLICGRALEYVTVSDERPACFEPADSRSGFRWDGDAYYLDVKDSETHAFFNRLSEGRHELVYECFVNARGTFQAGVVHAQSQYAPQHVAHSAGMEIEVVQE